MNKDILAKARELLNKQKESGKLKNTAKNNFDFKQIEDLILALRDYGQDFGSIFEVLRDQNGLSMTRSTFHRHFKALIDKTYPKPAAEDENDEQKSKKQQKKQDKPTEEKTQRLIQSSTHTADELAGALVGSGKTDEQPKNTATVTLPGYFDKK